MEVARVEKMGYQVANQLLQVTLCGFCRSGRLEQVAYWSPISTGCRKPVG